MAVVPRKKTTKKRRNDRRASGHGKVETIRQLAKCSNCGSPVLPHSVCHTCGFYKGRKVLAKLV